MTQTEAPATPQALTFFDVALYRGGMFGISRTNCKTMTIKTGQKYAQYSGAVRVEYLEKGKRKPHALMLGIIYMSTVDFRSVLIYN